MSVCKQTVWVLPLGWPLTLLWPLRSGEWDHITLCLALCVGISSLAKLVCVIVVPVGEHVCDGGEGGGQFVCSWLPERRQAHASAATLARQWHCCLAFREREAKVALPTICQQRARSPSLPQPPLISFHPPSAHLTPLLSQLRKLRVSPYFFAPWSFLLVPLSNSTISRLAPFCL